MTSVADIARSAQVIEFLPYQRRDIESTARFTWSCWSRQTGKSFGKSFKRVTRALAFRRNQVLLSAGMRQSRELMEKARMHLKALNVSSNYFQFDEIINGTSYSVERVELPNNVRIFALPANPDTARGFTGDVFLDEFAIHQNSRDIWGALYPTITRVNGEIDVGSTPKGKQGKFYELRSNPTFNHDVVTIVDAVRDGLQVDIEELKAGLGDPELYRQEFMCEFLDESAAFLTFEQIIACEDPELPMPVLIDGADEDILTRAAAFLDAIRAGGEFYLGIDIGRHQDLTALWLLERVSGKLITRGVLELRRMPFRLQWKVVRTALENPAIHRVSLDASGLGMALAEAAVEVFGTHRVDAVTFSLLTKSKLAGGLRVKVEDLGLAIPGCAEIRNDWHSLQKTVTTGGTVRYLAERTPDGHADRFWAAALAVDAASGPSGPIEYQGSERKLAFARMGIW